jgi:metal-responsive CopG/Arc/MetJ family transcriptional regulator
MKDGSVKKKINVRRKCVSLTPSYFNKIAKIRKKLGVSSDSEVIGRAIDNYMEKLGIFDG